MKCWLVLFLIVPLPVSANDYGCTFDDSKVAYSICLRQVSERLEDDLVLSYKLAATKAKHIDETIPFGNSLEEALQASEVAWEKYRKAQCNIVFVGAKGGNGAGIFFQKCSIEMTIQRIEFLRNMTN